MQVGGDEPAQLLQHLRPTARPGRHCASASTATTDCRGANTPVEFDRQGPRPSRRSRRSNADVLGVNEIENDGYAGHQRHRRPRRPASTRAALRQTPTPSSTRTPRTAINTLGTDAIKVGMLYKPALVTPIGRTAALNTVAFVNGGDNAPRSRPSLAQAFGSTRPAGLRRRRQPPQVARAPRATTARTPVTARATATWPAPTPPRRSPTWLDSPTRPARARTTPLSSATSTPTRRRTRSATLEEAGFTNLVAKYRR